MRQSLRTTTRTVRKLKGGTNSDYFNPIVFESGFGMSAVTTPNFPDANNIGRYLVLIEGALFKNANTANGNSYITLAQTLNKISRRQWEDFKEKISRLSSKVIQTLGSSIVLSHENISADADVFRSMADELDTLDEKEKLLNTIIFFNAYLVNKVVIPTNANANANANAKQQARLLNSINSNNKETEANLKEAEQVVESLDRIWSSLDADMVAIDIAKQKELFNIKTDRSTVEKMHSFLSENCVEFGVGAIDLLKTYPHISGMEETMESFVTKLKVASSDFSEIARSYEETSKKNNQIWKAGGGLNSFLQQMYTKAIDYTKCFTIHFKRWPEFDVGYNYIVAVEEARRTLSNLQQNKKDESVLMGTYLSDIEISSSYNHINSNSLNFFSALENNSNSQGSPVYKYHGPPKLVDYFKAIYLFFVERNQRFQQLGDTLPEKLKAVFEYGEEINNGFIKAYKDTKGTETLDAKELMKSYVEFSINDNITDDTVKIIDKFNYIPSYVINKINWNEEVSNTLARLQVKYKQAKTRLDRKTAKWTTEDVEDYLVELTSFNKAKQAYIDKMYKSTLSDDSNMTFNGYNSLNAQFKAGFNIKKEEYNFIAKFDGSKEWYDSLITKVREWHLASVKKLLKSYQDEGKIRSIPKVIDRIQLHMDDSRKYNKLQILSATVSYTYVNIMYIFANTILKATPWAENYLFFYDLFMKRPSMHKTFWYLIEDKLFENDVSWVKQKMNSNTNWSKVQLPPTLPPKLGELISGAYYGVAYYEGKLVDSKGGGASSRLIKVLGRNRKVIFNQRTKCVTYKGQLISLKEAKAIEKKQNSSKKRNKKT
jgi:hypothetical protein